MSTRFIEIIHQAEIRLSSMSTKTYPVKWRGHVETAIADEMIDKGFAIDPDAPPVVDDAPPAPTVAELEAMTVADLRQLAATAGIDGASAMKKAEMVAALTPPA